MKTKKQMSESMRFMMQGVLGILFMLMFAVILTSCNNQPEVRDVKVSSVDYGIMDLNGKFHRDSTVISVEVILQDERTYFHTDVKRPYVPIDSMRKYLIIDTIQVYKSDTTIIHHGVDTRRTE